MESSKRIHRWARNQPDPREYESAIQNLVMELDDREDLVDYENRRKALAKWHIGQKPWAALQARMPAPRGGFAPDFSDRKRNIASVIVWTIITNGEHVFAPTPISDQQDPNTQARYRTGVATFWGRMQRRTTRPADDQLITALKEYASYLTAIIDCGGIAPTEASPWA